MPCRKLCPNRQTFTKIMSWCNDMISQYQLYFIINGMWIWFSFVFLSFILSMLSASLGLIEFYVFRFSWFGDGERVYLFDSIWHCFVNTLYVLCLCFSSFFFFLFFLSCCSKFDDLRHSCSSSGCNMTIIRYRWFICLPSYISLSLAGSLSLSPSLFPSFYLFISTMSHCDSVEDERWWHNFDGTI